MDRRSFIVALPAGKLLTTTTARATFYFTGETVKNAMFPVATRFVDRSIVLDKAQTKIISKAAGTRVTAPKLIAFDAYGASGKLGMLLIDKVYGKHEFITYALALDTGGSVRRIEIMDYRESYGDQIRMPSWRAQFAGKRYGQPLQIDKQIKNISGATLSCVHVTDDVRRLLVTHALVLTA